jgi:hypothetical protein
MACAAVGYYDDTSGIYQGLIETLSGGTWTPTDAPLPANVIAGGNVGLYSAACPAAGSGPPPL